MKRREWWIAFEEQGRNWGRYGTVAGYNKRVADGTHVREVLPDDPDPEWVDELIVRAAAVCRHHKKWSWDDINLLEQHLAKRETK